MRSSVARASEKESPAFRHGENVKATTAEDITVVQLIPKFVSLFLVKVRLI